MYNPSRLVSVGKVSQTILIYSYGIPMNDVAFLMCLVNRDTITVAVAKSGLVTRKSDVASLMRLVNTGIELRKLSVSYTKRFCCSQERCSISDSFSDVSAKLCNYQSRGTKPPEHNNLSHLP